MFRVIKTELTAIQSECGSFYMSRIGSSFNTATSSSLLFMRYQGKQPQSLSRFWRSHHGVMLRNSLSPGSMLSLLADEFQLIAEGSPG